MFDWCSVLELDYLQIKTSKPGKCSLGITSLTSLVSVGSLLFKHPSVMCWSSLSQGREANPKAPLQHIIHQYFELLLITDDNSNDCINLENILSGNDPLDQSVCLVRGQLKEKCDGFVTPPSLSRLSDFLESLLRRSTSLSLSVRWIWCSNPQDYPSLA